MNVNWSDKGQSIKYLKQLYPSTPQHLLEVAYAGYCSLSTMNDRDRKKFISELEKPPPRGKPIYKKPIKEIKGAVVLSETLEQPIVDFTEQGPEYSKPRVEPIQVEQPLIEDEPEPAKSKKNKKKLLPQHLEILSIEVEDIL